jgi:hypothetical protein
VPAPCPGPCNNAWRKAEQLLAADGIPHDVPVTWGQPVHCQGCINRTCTQLLDLPELVVAIRLEALCGTAPKTTGTIGRAGAAAWPGQAARLLTDHIVGGLLDLEDDVRDLRQLRHRPGRGSEGRSATGAVRFLSLRLEWILAKHPLAEELHERQSGNPASQIHGWHRAAQRFTKQDEQRDTKRLAPCPRCHGPYLVESRDLRLVDDQPYIECRDPDCRRIMTGAEYDRYVKELNAALVRTAA